MAAPGDKPPDQRWVPQDQFVAACPEIPCDAKMRARLEDLLADNDCSAGTHSFLTRLYEALERYGSLTERQRAAVADIEERRDRRGHRSGF